MRILIADDEKDLRQLLNDQLTDAGYSEMLLGRIVATAFNGIVNGRCGIAKHGWWPFLTKNFMLFSSNRRRKAYMKKAKNRILYSIRILLSAYLICFLGLIIGEAVIILGSMPFGYNATDRQLPMDVNWLRLILFLLSWYKN